MKINTKNSEVLCLSRNQNQRAARKQQYNAAGEEVQLYLGGIRELRSNKLDTDWQRQRSFALRELFLSAKTVRTTVSF